MLDPLTMVKISEPTEPRNASLGKKVPSSLPGGAHQYPAGGEKLILSLTGDLKINHGNSIKIRALILLRWAPLPSIQDIRNFKKNNWTDSSRLLPPVQQEEGKKA